MMQESAELHPTTTESPNCWALLDFKPIGTWSSGEESAKSPAFLPPVLL